MSEEKIFSKYYMFPHLQMIHSIIQIFCKDFIVSESWEALVKPFSGLPSGAWSGRHRGNPTVIRTKNIKDPHHQVFLVLNLKCKEIYLTKIFLQHSISIIIPCCLAEQALALKLTGE